MGTRYDGTKTEVRALNAFIALQRAAESVEGATQGEIAKAGLTQSQFGVLEVLLHLGPMCAKDLAGKLLRSKGNLTLVVENLEKRGLIQRTRNDEDRRIQTVTLTKKGRGLIMAIFPEHVRGITTAFSGLTAAEQEKLREICRKLGRAQG